MGDGQMAFGDHIYVDRGFYTHHGVDIGDGWVIHFASADSTKSGALIRQATIEDFAGTGAVQVRAYGVRLDADQAVDRAKAMLGESAYDLFANNCEHFATWCVAGDHSSVQAEAATSGVSMVGIGVLAPTVGVGLVTSAGGAAAMSGPNLMSGLAAVGGSVLGRPGRSGRGIWDARKRGDVPGTPRQADAYQRGTPGPPRWSLWCNWWRNGRRGCCRP